MKIRVHPLFLVLAAVTIFFGKATVLLWTFVAVSFHELGHAVAARTRGYLVKNLTIYPFGAVMSAEENFDKSSSVIVGLAGPLTNALLALITLGIWWLFPAVYGFTRQFFAVNVSLALFNLLPVYPLDGSRVVLGLCINRIRAVKGLQIAGVTVSVMLLVLFVVSAFFEINYSFGILAVFLFYGAAFGTREELYVSLFSPAAKDYACGVEHKTVAISASAPLSRLFRFVNPNTKVRFLVTDGEKKLCDLDESKLSDLAMTSKLSSSVGQALQKHENG